ncbi:ATP-binding protein [Tepidimonas taiwanensis]|uniref:AAA domain protein n=1 Tax=Tepidimonas taiwanensis TaxID=307486 RepID=A0A554XA33_9BURK|nr:hypothetical protein [Tepidimonas taiwanensis]MCX7692121.1 ATP-binding protein [Tepidimonas taiwanensis]TSE32710.1 hypothetical protein Ttaiw_01042 [Tepidimonas taiwanensis]UBQ05447.1 ATP-binding protein [Tepidimonas taiwanensis]
MGTIVGYVTPKPPGSRLRRYPTKVINIIGGPGCDKSLFSSAIVLKLHLMQRTVEHIPDVAKMLVWQEDWDALRNQYAIALQQHRLLQTLDGQVHYLVTEGGLPQLLYYNAHYADNICDIEKTRRQILEWYRQFDNINIFAQRDPEKPYIQAGRLQDENRARQIDHELRNTLAGEGIHYTLLPAEHRKIIEWAGSLP